MSWRATAFWSLLAVLVGFGLFHVEYQVQKLEDQLTRLNRDIVREQEQIHVLRAEETYLNRPERIEQLAQKYLNLVPPKANQIDTVAQLPMRPPATPVDPASSLSSRQQSMPPAKSAPDPAPQPKAPPLMTPTPVAAIGLDNSAPLPGGGR